MWLQAIKASEVVEGMSITALDVVAQDEGNGLAYGNWLLQADRELSILRHSGNSNFPSCRSPRQQG